MRSERQEFSRATKAAAFMRANGHCEKCGARLQTGRFQYDHVVEAALGGDATLENCEVLCNPCHDEKTHKESIPRVAKMKRVRDRHIGAKTSRTPMPFGRGSKWKRKMDGTIVPRER